jgi:hypothetical protein
MYIIKQIIICVNQVNLRARLLLRQPPLYSNFYALTLILHLQVCKFELLTVILHDEIFANNALN